MKAIQLPKKALHPSYSYGSFEFYKSEADYENCHIHYIELPKWMINAIDAYAEEKAKNAVDNRLMEIRKALTPSWKTI